MYIKKLLTTFLFSFITFVYFSNYQSLGLHIDEHEWLRRGMVFFDSIFIDHNFKDPIWKSYYSRDQSHLTEYIFAGWTYLKYHESPNKLMKETNFNQNWTETGSTISTLWTEDKWWIKYAEIDFPKMNIPREFQPAVDIILYNRVLSILAFIGTTIVTFSIANQLIGYIPACCAVIFLAFHPYNLIESKYAMLGSITTFFFTISLKYYLHLQKNSIIPTKQICVMGILTGLTAGIRLDGIIVPVMITAIEFKKAFISTWRNHISTQEILKQWKRFFKNGAIICCLSGILFILINPFTWPSPFTKTYEMITWRTIWTNKLAKKSPRDAIPRLIDRYLIVSKNVAAPKYFAHCPWSSWVMSGLFSIGIIHCLIRSKKSPPLKAFLSWSFILFFSIASYMQINFSRYHLALLPISSIIHGAGMAWIIRNIIIHPQKHNHEKRRDELDSACQA